MAVRLLTVSEYARHRSCDEKAVRKAIQANRITVVEKDGKRWIDPEVADIQWARNTRARARSGEPAAAAPAAQAGPGAAQSGGVVPGSAQVIDGSYLSYDQARAMRENEEAMRSRIARLEEEGALTSAEDVGRAIWTAFRMLRDSAMPLGRTISGKLVGLTDQREIARMIDAGQRQVLATFRDKLLAELANKHGGGAAAPADLADAAGGANDAGC